MSKDEQYRVGRGQPPKHTQYKKGQSGNPSGRKKHRTLADEIVDLLDQEVDLTVSGTATRMTYRKAIGLAAINKAARGDLRASEFVRVLEVANDNAQGPEEEDRDEAAIEDVIQRYVERLMRRRSGGSVPEPDHE